MTFRQRILKWLYPLLMRAGVAGGKAVLSNHQNQNGMESFYDLETTLNNGSVLDFNTLRGKKVLLVNTASHCGLTAQYAELQSLYEREKGHLVIIGFPANDFKEQEKGSDEEIARFCQVNYGVTFPLARKSTVVRSGEQNTVYRWLTEKERNGWNGQEPTWNFAKYLVDESGSLLRYFDPSVSPLSPEVRDAVR